MLLQRAFRAVKGTLPVLTAEIGDTWIHGVGTDPFKVSQFRELLRLRKRWFSTGKLLPDSEPSQRFHRSLLLVAEHTWGMDLKTHLLDYDAYNRDAFDAARSQDNFRNFEASWSEQREYIHSAVAALPAVLAEEAEQRLESLQPDVPDLDEAHIVADPSVQFRCAHYEIGFDRKTGAIQHLRLYNSDITYADPDHLLGLFCYQTFSAADYERYFLQYNINRAKNWIWVLPDFTKPGLEDSMAVSREYTPVLDNLHHVVTDSGHIFVVELRLPDETYKLYGCPRKVFLEVYLPNRSPILQVQLKWFDKPANRMPEAMWLSFNPKVRTPSLWRMDKLGDSISPLEVIRDGNRKLHAVNSGLYHQDHHSQLAMQSLDAPLVAPGERSLLDFNNRQPKLSSGFHFCLYNNIWGTNFPMWYDDDGLFRFNLQVENKNTKT
jgi:hypothetical protein